MRSMHHPDPTIIAIIEGLIRDSDRGIPVLINRNPTISIGGIIQAYVVGICDDYTMSISLQIIKGLAADFDRIYCPYIE